MYPVHPDALFEAFMGTGPDGRAVALYDVSGLLPQHKAKRYKRRALQSISQQYVHHSGALRTGDPCQQLRSSTAYSIRTEGWPGCAYTTWQPYFDVFDGDGRRVVYRGQPSEVRTYHAGTGPNDRAVSHCLQGKGAMVHAAGDAHVVCRAPGNQPDAARALSGAVRWAREGVVSGPGW